MNIYEPTGKKIENWPQMVGRLSEENLELKRRCSELFTDVIEAGARNAK